ncbi:MAG: hypothetical protein PHC51_13575, partial [bacterium]|nr:hypothetical protein [bacterium]
FSAPLSEENLTALRSIRQVDRVDVHSSAAGEVTYNLVPKNRQEVFSEVFSCLQNRSISPQRISVHQGELDEVFRQVTDKDIQ